MTEKHICWEEMTTRQLDEILHVELGKKTKDKEKIIGILRVLEERDAENPALITKEVRQAWQKYQDQEKRTEPSKIKSILLKVTAVAAILCLIIFAVPPIFGEASFIDAIATWTDEIFRFTGTPQETSDLKNYEFKTDHPGLQEIYNTVTELGITEPVVPMWLPADYKLTSIETIQKEHKMIVSAILKNGEHFICFMIDISTENAGREYTKETIDAEQYDVGSVSHYIIKNKTESKVVWCVKNIKCTISIIDNSFGVYKLIDSIYGGKQ